MRLRQLRPNGQRSMLFCRNSKSRYLGRSRNRKRLSVQLVTKFFNNISKLSADLLLYDRQTWSSLRNMRPRLINRQSLTKSSAPERCVNRVCRLIPELKREPARPSCREEDSLARNG